MKKEVIVTLILLILVVGCLPPIKAQYQGNVTVNADGSISPSTAPIHQAGNIYTLTGDMIGSISILRSNLTFDGNGHSLVGLGLNHGVEGLSVGHDAYANPPVVTGASNVTVKNLNVKGSMWGISLMNASNSLVVNNTVSETGNGYLSMDQQTAGIYIERGGSNVIKGNTLSNNYNGMIFVESTNNIIVGNTIANCYNPFGFSAVGIAFWEASNNTIYHNNFLNNTAQAYGGITIAAAGVAPLATNRWDNGFPSGGNYWSDYQTKYPNASGIENSGVGSTPYSVDSQNKDNYPLMEPFSAHVSAASNTSPENPTASTQEDFPTAMQTAVLAASVVAVTVVIVGLAVYFKKRRR